MKKQFKAGLAALVAAIMVLCVFPACVVFADNEKLIDLDFSTYVKDTSGIDPDYVEISIGGITNSGTLKDTTIVKMSSQSGRWTNLDLSLETFPNAEGGVTPYLHRTINTDICQDANRFNTIDERALEESANTISFWAKYTPVNRDPDTEYNLFDYSVTYDGEKDGEGKINAKHLFTLDQAPTKTGKFRLVGKYQSPSYGDITDEAADKWAQYVIVNPAYEDGKKTMEVFVNGVSLGSSEIQRPEGDLLGAKLAFGGEADPAHIYWPMDFGLADVSVYNGALTADEILANYEEAKDRFTEHDINKLPKLTDLDLSTYVKDTSTTDPNEIEGSVGSIANSGSLSETTVIKMSSQGGRWTKLDLSLKSFPNAAGGETPYLQRTINTNTCNDDNRFNVIEEKALEECANTIYFWAKYVPENRDQTEYNLFDYSVKYSGGEANSLFALDQAPTLKGSFTLVGKGQTPVYGDITDEAAGKWAQYVITNPEYDESGKKTVEVFVNGSRMGSVEVTRPEGDIESAKFAFGGETLKSYVYWPTNLSLGKIEVYEGVLSEKDIAAKYEAEAAEFTEDYPMYETAEKLIELDLSDFGYSLEKENAGIKNTGTSETADLDIHSTEQVMVNKDYLYSKDMQTKTPFIHMTHPYAEFASRDGVLDSHFSITDNCFEAAPVTVSAWVNLDKGTKTVNAAKYCAIMQYSTEYTYKESTGYDIEEKPIYKDVSDSLKNSVFQMTFDTDGSYKWCNGTPEGGYNVSNMQEWHQLVMVFSPVEQGFKNIKTYVDGALKGEAYFAYLPERTYSETGTITIGSTAAGKFTADNISVGSFTVYGGAFEGADVQKLYDAQRGVYVDNAGVAKVTFRKTDYTEFLKLDDFSDGDEFNIHCSAKLDGDIRVFAASFDEAGNLLECKSADIPAAETNAEIPWTYTENTDIIKVYTWMGGGANPVKNVSSVEKHVKSGSAE